MHRLVPALAAIVFLGACATGEVRLGTADEALESQARDNDLMAKIADRSGSPEAAHAYRKKAFELRAAKKTTPGFWDILVDVGEQLAWGYLLGPERDLEARR